MKLADLRLPGPAWALDIDTVEAALATDHRIGLTTAEASARLTPRRPGLAWLGRGVLSWSWRTTIRYVALGVALAALASAAGASHIAAAFVFLAFAKAILGGVALWVALRAFADVEARARVHVVVQRDGREARVRVDSVAVGDIVRLRPGTIVQDDVRLADVAGLILVGPLGTRYGMVDVARSRANGNMACRGDEIRAGSGIGIACPTRISLTAGRGITRASAARSLSGAGVALFHAVVPVDDEIGVDAFDLGGEAAIAETPLTQREKSLPAVWWVITPGSRRARSRRTSRRRRRSRTGGDPRARPVMSSSRRPLSRCSASAVTRGFGWFDGGRGPVEVDSDRFEVVRR